MCGLKEAESEYFKGTELFDRGTFRCTVNYIKEAEQRELLETSLPVCIIRYTELFPQLLSGCLALFTSVCFIGEAGPRYLWSCCLCIIAE